MVFQQPKNAWETGGRWEVEAAAKVIMLMTLWPTSPGLHTKMHSSKQPNLLRKDLRTCHLTISAPALARWGHSPWAVVPGPSRLRVLREDGCGCGVVMRPWFLSLLSALASACPETGTRR